MLRVVWMISSCNDIVPISIAFKVIRMLVIRNGVFSHWALVWVKVSIEFELLVFKTLFVCIIASSLVALNHDAVFRVTGAVFLLFALWFFGGRAAAKAILDFV